MSVLDRWLEPVERALQPLADRINAIVFPVWSWSAALAITGLGAIIAPAIFWPAADEHVTLLGHPWGETCGFYLLFGLPCPQCGMTRSWLWIARGDVVRALQYSPGGTTLWLWLVAAGGIGVFRLATGRHDAWAPSKRLMSAWTMFWTIGLWAGVWLARVTLDVLPLPMPHETRIVMPFGPR